MAQALCVELDVPTAAQVAMFFETSGMRTAAAKLWQAVSFADPEDWRARERAADLLFESLQEGHRLGTVGRSRMILGVLDQSCPSKKVADAYFENLEALLRPLEPRARGGQVVLGVGTGRSGSTTLSGIIAGVEGACATHENPPLISWQPRPDEIDFHIRRFRLLSKYYAMVFEASHWWLGAVDHFLREFPEGKIIGLYRDTAACVRSFLSIKGSGRGTINHWAAPNNGIWASTLADPTYPSYPVPEHLADDPDAAKASMIERYVIEYNQTLERMAARLGDRMLLTRTEDLSTQGTADRLSAFLGVRIAPPSASLNVGNTADSDRGYYRI